RLDDEAAEGRDLAAFPPRIEVAQRLAQIAANGAAETAASQQHDVVVEPAQQVMVESDLAELVDEHRGIVELLRAQQALEQRGLAAAQKSGDHVDGKKGGNVGHPLASSSSAISAGSSGSRRRPAILAAAGQSAARLSTISVRPVRLRSRNE